MVVRCELKSLVTQYNCLASLMMPNSYPCDGIFNLHLAIIKDSYILTFEPRHEKTCLWHGNMHPHSLISTFFVRCLDSIIPLLAIAKISRLSCFCSWACRFEYHLVATPEDRFSCDVARLIPHCSSGQREQEPLGCLTIFSTYCKIPKYSNTRKIAVIILKVEQYGSTIV